MDPKPAPADGAERSFVGAAAPGAGGHRAPNDYYARVVALGAVGDHKRGGETGLPERLASCRGTWRGEFLRPGAQRGSSTEALDSAHVRSTGRPARPTGRGCVPRDPRTERRAGSRLRKLPCSIDRTNPGDSRVSDAA